MKTKSLAVVLSVTMLLTLSCGIIDSLLGGGGAGTVANLWPDVPPIDGATKADLKLPAAASIFIQAAFQGKLEFIAYTTSKAPQDIQAFYTNERMQAAGWSAEGGGCANSGNTGATNAAFCIFTRNDNGKDIGLVIVVAQDDKTKQAQIFYVRIDVTNTPTPKP